MLQVYVSNVSAISNVCCKCFIWILDMLQWLYMYVASVCSNVSPVLDLCCKCFIWMLHMFRHMLQASIQNDSSVSDICCKCVYMNVVVAIHIFANVCL
jgi:hypothetical protein